jgi:uncharacterized protein (DUF1330 family)
MIAYLIVDIEVFDPAGFEEYRRGVPATIAAFGGKYLARGSRTEVLEGDWVPRRVVVLEFPSMTHLKDWYNSPEYAAIKASRENSSNARMLIVEGA